jgi:hypothetical protein
VPNSESLAEVFGAETFADGQYSGVEGSNTILAPLLAAAALRRVIYISCASVSSSAKFNKNSAYLIKLL